MKQNLLKYTLLFLFIAVSSAMSNPLLLFLIKMKKKTSCSYILVLICLLCCGSLVRAQWVLDYQFPPIGNESTYCISLVDTNAMWILTKNSYDSARIYKKIGSTLIDLNPNSFFRPNKIAGMDLNNAYINGYQQELFSTSNGGLSWIKILDSARSGNMLGGEAEFKTSIKCPDLILACLFYGDSVVFTSRFFKSTNRGLDWSYQDLVLPYGSYFFDISILDTSNYYVGINCQGEDLSIMSYIRTTDGGVSWSTKEFPQVSNNHIIMAPVINTQSQVGFTFSVGYYFYRYKTTNNGLTWSPPEFFSYGDNEGMAGIKYIDSTPVWICATADKVFESINGGADWYQMAFPLNADDGINCLDAIRKGGKYYAYIGTFKGGIYKLAGDISTIGIQNSSTGVPKSFELYQNFPNPFNPTTLIKFDVPKDGDISLKVFDITGREVYSVNEYKHAGSYELKFDGTNLASGIYFYGVQSGSFVASKKMALIK